MNAIIYNFEDEKRRLIIADTKRKKTSLSYSIPLFSGNKEIIKKEITNIRFIKLYEVLTGRGYTSYHMGWFAASFHEAKLLIENKRERGRSFKIAEVVGLQIETTKEDFIFIDFSQKFDTEIFGSVKQLTQILTSSENLNTGCFINVLYVNYLCNFENYNENPLEMYKSECDFYGRLHYCKKQAFYTNIKADKIKYIRREIVG